jgi:hypothetical protein
MLSFAVRVVVGLVLIAAVPYTLTVAALVVLWLNENYYDILHKNSAPLVLNPPRSR